MTVSSLLVKTCADMLHIETFTKTDLDMPIVSPSLISEIRCCLERPFKVPFTQWKIFSDAGISTTTKGLANKCSKQQKLNATAAITLSSAKLPKVQSARHRINNEIFNMLLAQLFFKCMQISLLCCR